ncbi:MAG: glycosyltransferase family 2 protein [Turicibacter sp.]
MLVSLVVPVFNEEEMIPIFYNRIKEELSSYSIEIIFINDGSTDLTENVLLKLSERDSSVIAISFLRNFGKESALFAGLEASSGDAVIPIDVDLQDPISVIPDLIAKWEEGNDVVLAKRIDRSSDSFLKRLSAEWFYKFHNKISKHKIEENVGDFRLLDRRIVREIVKLKEYNLFMKGILSWVGGKIAVIEYTREERVAGHSKFNGWKLWNLALEGITSFSTVPLRIWSYLGFAIASMSFIYGSFMVVDKIIFGNPVAGYPSLLVSILFLGGVQLIGIGVLGEYLGRVYLEVKQRPRYIIKRDLK